jgi:uncharacterized membrane protein
MFYWPSVSVVIVAAHVLANLVWIGALLSEALLLTHATWASDPAQAGLLARRIHTRLAFPAFVASLAAGLGRLLPARHAYAAMPWMWAKLGFALAIIVIHHVLGLRTRRMANGNVDAAQGVGVLGWLTFLFAAGAVLFAVAKSTP